MSQLGQKFNNSLFADAGAPVSNDAFVASATAPIIWQHRQPPMKLTPQNAHYGQTVDKFEQALNTYSDQLNAWIMALRAERMSQSKQSAPESASVVAPKRKVAMGGQTPGGLLASKIPTSPMNFSLPLNAVRAGVTKLSGKPETAGGGVQNAPQRGGASTNWADILGALSEGMNKIPEKAPAQMPSLSTSPAVLVPGVNPFSLDYLGAFKR